MTISTVLVIVLGAICYFILPFLLWALIKNQKLKTILTTIFICLYLGVLFVWVIGKLSISSKYIIVDFDFSGEWCAKNIRFFEYISTFDLVINLVMLFPIGMYIYYLAQRKKWWAKILMLLGFGLLTGLFIETCQFILPIPRSVQFSDAVFNMISIFVGGLIAWGEIWFINKFIRKNR